MITSMGSMASKRIKKSLQSSSEFNAACTFVYEECLDLSQRAFFGIRTYQLYDASARLHRKLSTVNSLVKKWIPSNPTRIQVDRALDAIVEWSNGDEEETIGAEEFREFVVELFKDAIISNSNQAVLQQISFGLVGIARIRATTRSGGGLVGAVMGIYVVGVPTAIFLLVSNFSLSIS